MSFKMCILVREDLKMSKGKVLAQVSHTIVDATVKAYTQSQLFFKWKSDGEKILSRIKKRSGRPLISAGNPKDILKKKLMGYMLLA